MNGTAVFSQQPYNGTHFRVTVAVAASAAAENALSVYRAIYSELCREILSYTCMHGDRKKAQTRTSASALCIKLGLCLLYTSPSPRD